MLTNIHEFVDAEVITHDDLNSIGESVSQEIGGTGNISSTSIAWPIVAQGHINMNGYSILNLGTLLGAIHVNDEKTLAQAISEASSGDVIIIDPAPSATASASDILINAKNNLTIMGYGRSSVVAVDTGVSGYGICVLNSCSRVTISGIRFINGTAGKPTLYIPGGAEHQVVGCHLNVAGTGLQVGSASTAAIGITVSRNVFDTCTTGLEILGSTYGSFESNKFTGCTQYDIKLPGTSDYEFHHNTISNNVMHDGAYGIYGNYATSSAATRGSNVIANNAMYSHSSAGISLVGFTNDVIHGNITDSAVVLGGYYEAFSENSVGGSFTLSADYAKLTGNSFSNVITPNSPTHAMVRGNTFTNGVTLYSWMDIFSDNVITAGTVTISSYPTVYGLNYGV